MRNLLVLATLAMALATASEATSEMESLVAEGKELIGDFGGTLKAELKAAIEEGGPVNAIVVCNTRAPEIASDISDASGWTVARSSHKLRNSKNAPDPYTAAAIEEFLARQAAGEAAADIAKAEVVETNGQRSFRLVKAIPTEEVCLACHGGDDVSPEVVGKLAELYPEDMARGFKAGEMRGVFTLTKPLD